MPEQSIDHWKNFFANHKKYTKVGRVAHRPIDPASPIPEPCQPEKPKGAKKETQAKPQQENPQSSKSSQQKHEEL